MAVLFADGQQEIAAAIDEARRWGFSPSVSRLKATSDGAKARVRLPLKKRSLGLGSLDTLYQRATSEKFQRAIVTFIGACREPVRLRFSQRGDFVFLTVWDAPWPLKLTETKHDRGDEWHACRRFRAFDGSLDGVVKLEPLPTVYAPLRGGRQFDLRLAPWHPPEKVWIETYDPRQVMSHWDIPTNQLGRVLGHFISVGESENLLGAQSVTIWVPVERILVPVGR